MHQGGEQALQEGRHGHPIKLRGEVRTFLEEVCRQDPHTPSHEIQTQLAQRFSLQVSVSQINRVRTTLGPTDLWVQFIFLPEEKTLWKGRQSRD
jgi:hypothetical protein